MMRKATLAIALCVALAGCTVKETEDEDGGTELDVQPANVDVGLDTATVKVPDIDVTPADSARDTTRH